MNLAAVLKPFFRPPDTRPEKQIESELDEEFAFHVEQIQRELLDAEPALSTEEASRRARARFGDVETLKKRCKRIAMEERIMLQRMNAVLMVVVMLAVIGVSVQVYLTQRHNSLALLDISSQIAKMRIDAAAEARERGWTSADEANHGGSETSRVRIVPLRFAQAEQVKELLSQEFGPNASEQAKRNVSITADVRTNSLIVSAEPTVWHEIVEAMKDLDLDAAGASTAAHRDTPASLRVLVEGAVENPGWYPITLDGATYLHEVLVEAAPSDAAQTVRIDRERGSGRSQSNYSIDHLLSEDPQKVVLRPGDEISVSDSPRNVPIMAGQRNPSFIQPGLWWQIDEKGSAVEGGATIEIMGPDDIENLRQAPIGALVLPEHELTAELLFRTTAAATNLDITASPNGHISHGRWVLDGAGRLHLNLGNHFERAILVFAPAGAQAHR